MIPSSDGVLTKTLEILEVVELRYKTMVWMKLLRNHPKWSRYFFDDFIRFFVSTYIIPENYTHTCTLTGINSVVSCLLVHNDKLYSVSDNIIRVWHLETNDLISTLIGHTSTVKCILAHANQVFTGGFDRTIKIWNIETFNCVTTLSGHDGWVLRLVMHQGYLYSGSADGTLRLWDLFSFTSLITFTGLTGHACSMVLYKDKLFSGHLVWNAHTGVVHGKLAIGHNSVHTMIIVSDFLYTAGGNNEIGVWSAETCENITTLHGHIRQVYALVASTDDKMLISGGEDHAIRVWSTKTHELLAVLRGHAFWVYAMTVKNSRLFSCAADNTVCVWDLNRISGADPNVNTHTDAGYELMHIMRGHTSGVHSIIIHKKILYTGSADWTLRKWICR